MQLIENGPDIPEHLLQAHEEGRVVFFCGAGISYPAGLPGFAKLLTRIRDEMGIVFSPTVASAFNRGQYDAAIGLLEGEMLNGRESVRRRVATILTPNLTLPDAKTTHEALLTLSRTRDDRQRLITTNFDRMFEEVRAANRLRFKSYEAPLLPVPKNRWDGVVYLHGLLAAEPTASDLNKLVLSSGDFGLAYLTERWAARFVGELFRSTTVCFVGYSINDPVLRYMMDALAADRLLGESPPAVFAFGSYKKTAAGEDSAAAEWRAKNVTPILYREYKHHYYLHRTLHEWSRVYRDGVLGKESIIARYAATKPAASTQEDNFIGRLLWALSHSNGLPAKRFAEFDPLPSLDWLEPMSKAQYGHADLDRFGIRANEKPDEQLAFSLVARPTPYALAAPMRLVGHYGLREGRFDEVMRWLAHWLSRHADDPQLLLWVASHGPRLHNAFSWHIERALERQEVRPAMTRLWRILLSGRVHDGARHRDLFVWKRRLARDGYSVGLRLELVRLLAPRVKISRPMRRSGEVDDGATLAAMPSIRDLVSWEIVLSSDDGRNAFQDLTDSAAWRVALRDLLPDLTGLLRDALDLMRELDGADERSDLSYVARPSIAPHEQNRGFHSWTFLIDLVRDAWVETAQSSVKLARGEVDRWMSLPYPLFRRLAFFAAAQMDVFTASSGLTILLANPSWLWSSETQREAIRLLVSIAPRLNPDEVEHLQNVVVAGPDRGIFREDADAEAVDRAIQREIWLRLIRLRDTGIPLMTEAAALLAEIEQRYPLWRAEQGDRDDFAFWMGDGADWDIFNRTPKGLRELIDWLRDNPNPGNFDRDDWRERCQKDFPRAAAALLALARSDQWPVARWSTAFQVWAEPALLDRSWRRFATLLAAAPDRFLRDSNHGISWWVEAQAKAFDRHESAFFTLVDRIVRLHREEHMDIRDNIIGQAINHPIGHAVEALFRWWYRQPLRDRQGLSVAFSATAREISDTTAISYRLGRVLLGANVIALYRVDPQWTRQHVLPLFDWERSFSEARGIWMGFLWSPRLYLPFVAEIKAMFLATARHSEGLGEHGEQYAGLLTYAGLEATELFTRAEFSTAFAALGERGRTRSARTLVDALEGADEQRSDYWQNRVRPFIELYWPRGSALRTPAISEQFARVCVASGQSFPTAFETLRDWLLPSHQHDLLPYRLEESGLCTSYPETALALLAAVISDDLQWPPQGLRECLEQIRQGDAAILNDARYQRLDQLLRRIGEY
jgi:hypothetical protein